MRILIICPWQLEREFQFSSVYICWQHCLFSDHSLENYEARAPRNEITIIRLRYTVLASRQAPYSVVIIIDRRGAILKWLEASMFTPDLPKKYEITNNRLLGTPNRQDNLHSHNNNSLLT